MRAGSRRRLTVGTVSRTSFSRRSLALRGFSFPEIAVTLVLLSILLALGALSFDRLRSSTGGVAAGPLLLSAQLEARRLVQPGVGYPESLVGDLVAVSGNGIDVVESSPSTVSQVSVLRVDAGTAVFAARAGEDCLVLLDRLEGSATWARLRSGAATCSAASVTAVVTALPVGGSSSSPQVVTGG